MRRFSRITEQRTTNTLTITVMLKLKMKGYCIEGVEAYCMKHVSRVSWSIGAHSFLLIETHGRSSVGPPPCNYTFPCSLSTSPSLRPLGSSLSLFIATRSTPRREHGLRTSTHSGHPREVVIPLLCFGRQRKAEPSPSRR